MKIFLALTVLAGCAQRLQVDPVTVKPIHVIVDVNVHDHTTPTPARTPDTK